MLEWIALGALALGGGGYVAGLMKRGRAHSAWKKTLEEVAEKLKGKASPATMFDAPELRATVDEITVTLKLTDIHKGPSGHATAESELPEGARSVRLYLGWDVPKTPTDMEHIPQIEARSTRVDGEVIMRADDAATGARFMKQAMIDLIDIRREAQSRAMEVIARGGYLKVVMHGVTQTSYMLERLVRTSVKLAKHLEAVSQGTALPAGEEAPKALPSGEATGGEAPPPQDDGAKAEALEKDAVCGLCDDHPKPGEHWVRCVQCGTPYHKACFLQANACLSCGETRSVPAPVAES